MKHEYEYDLVDGHIILRDGEARLLIDTGAPSSVGERDSLTFAGANHRVTRDYMGVTSTSLSSNIGSPVHALIGADLLNQYDMAIDSTGSVLTLTHSELPIAGERIDLDEFMGIPIVCASVGEHTLRMFFDTGAKLSYLHRDIAVTFPSDGTEEDFYPGLGKFRTETFTVPVSLGAEDIVLRVGVLPQLLQMTLMMADTSGILGTAVLGSHSICFAPRRKLLVLRRRST